MSQRSSVLKSHVQQQQGAFVLQIFITYLITNFTLQQLQNLGLFKQFLVVQLCHITWKPPATLDTNFTHQDCSGDLTLKQINSIQIERDKKDN